VRAIWLIEHNVPGLLARCVITFRASSVNFVSLTARLTAGSRVLPMTDQLLRTVAPVRHSLFEDAYAMLTGCLFVTPGMVWLRAAGLVTGGIAGLALLISYLVPLPPGVLFMLLNLPFFLLARKLMGRAAMLKAIIANLLISGLALLAPLAFRLEVVNSLFAALLGGTVIGAGILLLARHQVGVGGLGIMALALQKGRGWNAGRTQLGGDALILLAAIPFLGMGLKPFAISVLSAAAVAGVLIVFHKPGRYTGY
jgi:uncharacterized membrane-anchored protein YitT (DUF2179 family)